MKLRNTTVVLTEELIARLDRYVVRQRRRMPGYAIKRSALVRSILTQACDLDEASDHAQPTG